MSTVVAIIADNIKRLRELKNLSQKEVAVASGIPQGQYSRIENAKVEPAVSTLDKLATVFGVGLGEFFNAGILQDDINMPLLQKIKIIDTLPLDEQTALFKMIDLAVSNKRMKDNLQTLIAQ
jgi:transcriptional regulator with XRE-family HTH domain